MSTVRDKSEQAFEGVKNTYDKASDIVAEQSAVVADFVRGSIHVLVNSISIDKVRFETPNQPKKAWKT